jgi:dihydropteroate synthase
MTSKTASWELLTSLKIGSHLYDFSNHQIYIMGILNVTPDSFSDGGLYENPGQAIEYALQMQEEGADFIDIGAESTRPGAPEISVEEELTRLTPLLEKLIPQLKIPVSLDTRKVSVARRAIQCGVSLINDVSGFQFDPEMIPFLQQTKVFAILMHSRGTPETMSQLAQYESVTEELYSYFDKRLADLEKHGISRERLLIDPGIGFAKMGLQNVEILAGLDRLENFGRPVVIGLSRKSFLDLFFGSPSHPREREVGTEIAHALAILKGAHILRVHDVGAAKKTIQFVKEFKKFEKE